MFFQEIFAKNSILRIHNRIKNALGFLLIIGICGLLIYLVYIPEQEFIFGNTMQTHQLGENSYTFARIFSSLIETEEGLNYVGFIRSISMPYIPLVICMFFLSIICFICNIAKRILNIVGIIFSASVLVILLYLIFGLGFAAFVNQIDSALSIGIAHWVIIYLPLMTAAFLASIISIVSKIKNMFFCAIIVGVGIIYTFVHFFIQLSFEDNLINCAFIGDIIMWLSMLLIFGISAIIAMLPSVTALFIAHFIGLESNGNDGFEILNCPARGSLGLLGGTFIGAIAAPVLYGLAWIFELFACFFTCGSRCDADPFQSCGSTSHCVMPIWNATFFGNTVFFLMIAGCIVGTIFGIAKYIQDR
jgi:hypothetical protein